MTSEAPAARATPTAKQPIGPQPRTSTALPGTLPPSSTVWTAFPIGSMMAPISVGIPSSFITFEAGIAMYSAKAPSRSTPMIRVRRQTWASPVRQGRQWPQTMCPSAVTRSPMASSPSALASSPSSTISPANSCPMVTGGLSRPLAHASHSQMCRSVPQTPAKCTLISASLGPQCGRGTSRTSMPGPAEVLTRARMGVSCRERIQGRGSTPSTRRGRRDRR